MANDDKREDQWEQLDLICKEAVNDLHREGSPETILKMSLCYALQECYRNVDLSKRDIDRMILNLLELENLRTLHVGKPDDDNPSYNIESK